MYTLATSRYNNTCAIKGNANKKLTIGEEVVKVFI